MTVYARRSARVLLIDSGDRILLIRSAVSAADPALGHVWFTPGGGVGRGEGLAEAAARELHEEVGLKVSAAELHPVAYTCGHADLGWAKGLFRDDLFLCRIDRHEVDTSLHTDLERRHYRGHHWWTLAELANTTETIYPWGLHDLLVGILAGQLPTTEIELPWHH